MSDSSDQDNIFSNTESGETKTADASTDDVKPQEPSEGKDQFADLLGTITTEDGRQKFNDVDSALNSIPHAQKHISSLEGENLELKHELEKRKTAEELLEAIKQSGKGKETPSSPALDEAQLAALVDSRLNAQQTEATQKTNLQEVTSQMKEKFGDKAESTFYDVAKSLGMSMDAVNNLAKKSPEAVLKLMGVEGNISSIPEKSSSSINTETLKPQEPGKDLKFKSGQSMNDMVDVWKRA